MFLVDLNQMISKTVSLHNPANAEELVSGLEAESSSPMAIKDSTFMWLQLHPIIASRQQSGANVVERV